MVFSNNVFINIFIILILLLFIIWLTKYDEIHKESFSQLQPFSLCKDDNYDQVYIEKYNEIFKTKEWAQVFCKYVIDNTKLTIHSKMLDIGCGSGYLMDEMKGKNYKIEGIDKSKYIAKSNNTHKITHNDVTGDAMLYDTDSFSHIFCTNFTIYEVEDQSKLLRHCYFWLKGNGNLIIHLADMENFNKIIPSSPLYKEYCDQNITCTTIEMIDYDYKNNYKKITDKLYIQQEEFRDKQSGKIRQYEKTLYVNSKENIIKMAKDIGFKLTKDDNCENELRDKFQYFIIFTKPLCGDL